MAADTWWYVLLVGADRQRAGTTEDEVILTCATTHMSFFTSVASPNNPLSDIPVSVGTCTLCVACCR